MTWGEEGKPTLLQHLVIAKNKGQIWVKGIGIKIEMKVLKNIGMTEKQKGNGEREKIPSRKRMIHHKETHSAKEVKQGKTERNQGARSPSRCGKRKGIDCSAGKGFASSLPKLKKSEREERRRREAEEKKRSSSAHRRKASEWEERKGTFNRRKSEGKNTARTRGKSAFKSRSTVCKKG